MTGRFALRYAGALAVVAALAMPRAAAAQDTAAAEALFTQGRELMASGDLASACPKLAESQRLDPSSGTMLNLALCHKKQGKTATAWAEYKTALRLAQQQNKPEREAAATAEIAALEPLLAYLTIEVAAEVPGLEVRRDGVRLEAGSFGAKLPVDPGKHVVIAQAPGYKAATLEVVVDGAATVLRVPALEKEADSAAPIVVAPVTPIAPARGPGALPWIVGGSGVAIVGVGAVFGVLAGSTYDDAKKACPLMTNCSSSVLDKRSSANTQANVANVMIGVGAAAVVTGVVLYIVRRKPAKPAQIGRSLEVSF